MGIGDFIGAVIISALVSAWLVAKARAIPRRAGVRWRLGRMIGASALAPSAAMAFYLVVQYLSPSEERREALIRAAAMAVVLPPMCFVMVLALAVDSIRRRKGCGRFFWRPVEAAHVAEGEGK